MNRFFMSMYTFFYYRIMEVYRRIGLQGRWVEVDTGGTQEESLQKALKGLRDIGVLN